MLSGAFRVQIFIPNKLLSPLKIETDDRTAELGRPVISGQYERKYRPQIIDLQLARANSLTDRRRHLHLEPLYRSRNLARDDDVVTSERPLSYFGSIS